MKYSGCVAATLALCATEVVAFPSRMFDLSMDENEKRAIAKIASSIESEAKDRRQLVAPGFDAAKQHVSTTGQYAYVAPGPNDLRGPCPGLNAMANHGYIPHNGVATISQFIQGTYDVFGMATDLATFLAVYGAIFDGDLTAWSIGGTAPAGLLSAVPLLGEPTGLIGSHNKYESDVSPTRPDLYEYGNDYKFIMSQFEQMYNLPLGQNGYDLSVLTPFRASRFQQSMSNNPYFFNGPFSGVVVQPAAYTFIYRFMSNKSAEFPEGYLNGEVLKSFFGVTGEPGSFVWTEGSERIPDNWYKRAIGDEYTIPFFGLDAVAAGVDYPEFVDVGGNTGKVNTFTGVDITNLTAGVFDGATLLEGNNLLCFGLQSTANLAPDLLKGLLQNVEEGLEHLSTALAPVVEALGCPQLQSIDTSELKNYPGATGAY